MKQHEIKIEKYTGDRATIPTLVVNVVNNETSKVVATGYLTPSRGYCFRVSANDSGAGEMGSSPTMRLGRIARMNNNAYELLLGQVMLALQDFASSDATIKVCDGNIAVINKYEISKYDSILDKWLSNAAIPWLKKYNIY